MITPKRTIKCSELRASARDFLSPDMLFTDIETTGLSADRSFIYCIGCSWMQGDEICIQLFFGTGESDEALLLTEFAALSRRFSTIVTFNGTTFDLPFLKKRFQKYQIPHPLADMESLDLFRETKKLKKLLALDNYRQKNVELFLGCFREDAFSGKELIRVYQDFCKSPSEEKLQMLLLHNFEDVLGMYDLLGILSYQELLHGGFSITACRQENDFVQTELRPSHTLPQPLTRIEENWQLSFKPDHVFLNLPLHTGTLRHYFPDYKNYFYLPEEDTIIHKDIGIYVDRTRREKVSKENCFLKKDCSYLILPGRQKGYESYLKADYKDTAAYLEVDSQLLSEPDHPQLYPFICQLFRYYL